MLEGALHMNSEFPYPSSPPPLPLYHIATSCPKTYKDDSGREKRRGLLLSVLAVCKMEHRKHFHKKMLLKL